jgi:hypothetical protein
MPMAVGGEHVSRSGKELPGSGDSKGFRPRTFPGLCIGEGNVSLGVRRAPWPIRLPPRNW